MTTKWTAADIPDQRGRVALVTGSNGGLGYVTARELARSGATVMLLAYLTELRVARALMPACSRRLA